MIFKDTGATSQKHGDRDEEPGVGGAPQGNRKKPRVGRRSLLSSAVSNAPQPRLLGLGAWHLALIQDLNQGQEKHGVGGVGGTFQVPRLQDLHRLPSRSCVPGNQAASTSASDYVGDRFSPGERELLLILVPPAVPPASRSHLPGSRGTPGETRDRGPLNGTSRGRRPKTDVEPGVSGVRHVGKGGVHLGTGQGVFSALGYTLLTRC